MCTVGQDEIVIVLECTENEDMVPRDVFCHLNSVYEQASKGERRVYFAYMWLPYDIMRDLLIHC